MTRRENKAQEVVTDVIVDRTVEIRHFLLRLKLVRQLLMLALDQFVSAQDIDRTMLRGGHEPGTRVLRYARLRPLLERGNESVLSQFLRHADVAHDSREASYDPR